MTKIQLKFIINYFFKFYLNNVVFTYFERMQENARKNVNFLKNI